MEHLHLLQAYTTGLARGTWKNKRLHLLVYVAFCHEHCVNPLNPSTYNIVAFLVHQTFWLKPLESIYNYFSLVMTWFASIKGFLPCTVVEARNRVCQLIFTPLLRLGQHRVTLGGATISPKYTRWCHNLSQSAKAFFPNTC